LFRTYKMSISANIYNKTAGIIYLIIMAAYILVPKKKRLMRP